MRTLEWLTGKWWLALAISLVLAWTFWPEYRRYAAVSGIDGAPVQATLLQSVPGTRRSPDEHFYEYRVDGRRYAGSYACGCEEFNALKRGETFPLRYAIAQPQVNLPAFTLSRAAQTGYWMLGTAVLAALGLLGAAIRLARWLAGP